MKSEMTKRFKGWTSIVSILAVSGALLAGCSGTSESQTSSDGDTIPNVSLDGVQKSEQLSARVPSDIAARGKLIVGSDTTFAPAEFLAGPDGNTPVGFDVDLSNAIAKKLGLDLDFQSANFDSILPALGTKYDIGASAFYITKKRLEAVNMVSYQKGGSTLLVKAGNPHGLTLDNLCGQTIAVQTGSTQLDDLQEFSKKCQDSGEQAIDAVELKTNAEAITRLSTDGAVGVLSGQTLLGYAATQSHGQLETIDATYNAGIDGIAVAKSDTEFAQLIADTINELINDGTYAQIMSAWGQKGLVERADVNPETSM
ncbi:ABC transporter substrate-binding protein [Pseudoclavibacter sp. CFCC 13796]|uniref:ABC transporter substrate-binding protein n=1 Tax=Pseudoclavibacter sp. CFCC 13796 TaxID=2615179 RepID=UPI001300CFC5|nr:ABC transporter substrate-binding protein [Pseudoclavibacter sp. CFCC 13796]KAB1660867.1 ABC transporter substrate-binding protein [Pseudoclavibacter sp. CFCC 13796]